MLLTQSTNLSRTPKSICPIEAVDNAQIRLYPNGVFTTRSNDVETVWGARRKSFSGVTVTALLKMV